MKVTAFAFAAAIALALGTLQVRLFTDDYLQLARVRGEIPESMFGSAWDLFRFSPGGDRQREVIARGFYPWWMPMHSKGAVLRPLSSALVHFDVAALGDSVTLWHLHSI